MKKIRKKLSYVLSLCMLLLVLPINISAAVQWYSTGSCGALLNNGVLTVSGEGRTMDHNNYFPQPWLTRIEEIHTVIIEDDVTGIGNNTFKYMRALKNVTIGKNVTELGANAFIGCENLENIYWNATEVEDLDDDNTIFSDCGTSAGGITVTFGENVKYIPANLFWSSNTPKIEKVVFNGPVEIGYDAFAFCNELEVHISSVEDWCKSKFRSTASNPLIAESSLYLDGEIIKDLKTTKNLKEICEMAFIGCTSIETLTIKDGLTKIGKYAFADCSNLKKVYLPKSLESIGAFAFDIGLRNSLDIYYAGTEEEWNEISKDYFVDDFMTVTMHYNEIYEKKDFEGITLENEDFVYDGSEKELRVSGTLPAGANVEYVNNKATDVGIYEVEAIVTGRGYNDLELTATLEITPVELEVIGFGAEDKTYDGTTDATLTEGTLVGLIEGDDVEVVYPEKGDFASKDASTKAIAVSYDEIALAGEDVANYTLKQPGKISAKIGRAPIEVTADDITIRLGDEIPALTYKITSGELFGDDELEGSLKTTARNNKVGNYDITKGTLKVSGNYTLTFKNGILSVVDKTVQDVAVAEIEEKIYGNEKFVLEVTDGNEELGEIAFESSNTDVAEIAADGTITIKAAGKTDISVLRAGNDEYADFAKVQTLVVNKVAVTVNATEGQGKRVGTDNPAEFLYTYEGSLVGEDSFTGALTRTEGEEIGFYDITIGTLAINDNYAITFNGAKFEITAKTPQTITFAEIPALTYGDAAYTVIVTKDATSNLEAFTYESDNTDVLSIADGVITVIGAGEATITVVEPGNEEYAEAKASQKVTVSKKDVTLTALDIEAKTATIEGVVGEDVLSVDFDKIVLTKGEETEADTVDVTVSNLVLTGDAANYNLTTESFVVSLAKDKIYAVAVTAENAEITGAGAYLAGSEVTLTVTPAKRYVFKGWYIGEELISEETSYTFTLNEDIALTALLEKKKSGGGTSSGSISLCRVEFDTDGGEAIYARKVEYGEKLGFVADAVKEGYVFEGWFLDSNFETAYSEDMSVTKDITLYAKWTKEGENKDSEKKELVLTIGDKEASVFGEAKENDVAPVIRNERTMLPARFVAEALGATVSWNDEKRAVTIEKGEIKIVIVIDSEKAFIGEEEVTLDSPAFIENDRTYTPIRFIAEALGASVAWDEATQKVTITVK